MISFKPPQTNYSSFDDIARFNMIWGVSFLLVPLFFTLFIIHLIFGDQGWVTSLSAIFVAAANLLLLFKTRKYGISAAFFVVMSVIMCQILIFLVDDSPMVANVMWCILISFFTFFMAGSILGTLVLIINISGIIVFMKNNSLEVIMERGIAFTSFDLGKVVNIYFVTFALSLLFARIMNNRKKVNHNYDLQITRNETLLKEIHHRVKNNLQIISSLLRLQAAEIEDEKVNKYFDEAIGRIRSIALIHERMYGDGDLSNVDIKSYLESLSEEIMSSIQNEKHIETTINSSFDKIDIKSVVPISLIFNELLTNSLKHGFAKSDKGVIRISLQEAGDKIVVIYADSGEWKQPTNPNSFGLELIRTLTDQLEGKMNRNSQEGTVYTFEFSKENFFFT